MEPLGSQERARVLVVEQLSRRFGGVAAVEEVSFELFDREVLAIVGPNGAGKSPLFHLLTGRLRADSGEVYLFGERVTRVRLSGRARRGMAAVYQDVRLFDGLTIAENVMVGLSRHVGVGTLALALRLSGARRREEELAATAQNLLEQYDLAAYQGKYPREVPYGVQRRAAIARAMATRPRLLLLDEPAAGLTSQERPQLRALVQAIGRAGVAVLLIEHDLGFVSEVASRIMALNRGRVVAVGTPREVLQHPAFVEAYVGRGRFPKEGPDAGG